MDGAWAALEFRADYSCRAPNCNGGLVAKTSRFQPFLDETACGGNAPPLRAARFPGSTNGQIEIQIAATLCAQTQGHPAFGPGDVFERIADALERLSPQRKTLPDLSAADAFVWHPDGRLALVPRVNRVEMSLLKGIDRVRDVLVENTERFAKGLPANNALLWGARGMGKSSLVKAAHAGVNAAFARNAKSGALKLIEIHREDIDSLPALDGPHTRLFAPLYRVLR